jgi:hypothetical protein
MLDYGLGFPEKVTLPIYIAIGFFLGITFLTNLIQLGLFAGIFTGVMSDWVIGKWIQRKNLVKSAR